MDRRSELLLWKRLDRAGRRIRNRVFRLGMAGRWHIGKATDILGDPGLVERWVVPLDEEYRVRAYLESLPRLIERTRIRDDRCAELWESSASRGESGAYVEARARLARLFVRFKFHSRVYERLVRQPDKPLLKEARRLLEGDTEPADDASGLESTLRLKFREFVDLEEATARDLRVMDGSRAEIVSAYEGYARKVAGSLGGPDPETTAFALCGLTKAAEYYTHRRGYRFRTYARFWIEQSVREKKAWGLRRPASN